LEFGFVEDTLKRETIDEERQIIREMSDEQRDKFITTIYKLESLDGKKYCLDSGITMGVHNKGFAVDSDSLFYVTTGQSLHKYASQKLINYFKMIHQNVNEDRIISGMIYINSPDFSSPILVVNKPNLCDGYYKNVIDFLNHQNFITVNEKGDLVE